MRKGYDGVERQSTTGGAYPPFNIIRKLVRIVARARTYDLV
jgi:hypothetical protein